MGKRIPKLYGTLERIEYKWFTPNGIVFHLFKIFHGQRTFAGKEPFKVHLVRFVPKYLYKKN